MSKKVNRLRAQVARLKNQLKLAGKVHDKLDKHVDSLNVRIAALQPKRPNFPGHVLIEIGQSMHMRGERVCIQFAIDEYIYRTFGREPRLMRQTVRLHCEEILRELENGIMEYMENKTFVVPRGKIGTLRSGV